MDASSEDQMKMMLEDFHKLQVIFFAFIILISYQSNYSLKSWCTIFYMKINLVLRKKQQ